MNFKQIGVVFAAFCMAFIIYLGILNNKTTKINEETEDFRVTCNQGFRWIPTHTTCDLTLSENIEDAKNYEPLFPILSRLTSKDKVNLHLRGNGGLVDGALYLDGMLKHSKAYVTAKVEGNVYSAHAYLSVAFNKTDIDSNGIMMFHNGSNTNEEKRICKSFKGSEETDRGISMYEKCLEQYITMSRLYNNILFKFIKPVLTNEEYKRVEEGYDVFLDLGEFKKRIEGAK